jgi:hypothetical protein
MTVRFSFVICCWAPPPNHLPVAGMLCFLELNTCPTAVVLHTVSCYVATSRNAVTPFLLFRVVTRYSNDLSGSVHHSTYSFGRNRNQFLTPRTIRLPIALGNYLGRMWCIGPPFGTADRTTRLPLSIGFLCSVPLGRDWKSLSWAMGGLFHTPQPS